MTKSELFAQADGLEWAAREAKCSTYIDMSRRCFGRASELRAQAEKAVDPQPVAWYSPASGLPYGWTEEPPTADAIYLYTHPDPRIAEYRELLLETLPDEPLADDSPDGDLVKRIRAALEKP